MWEEFVTQLEIFLDYGVLPELMQGAGGAVLSILISLALGVFGSHIVDADERGGILDLHLILDYVWNFKGSLFALVVLVISPFFMVFEDLTVRIVAFSIWFISFLVLIKVLLQIYNWIQGDRNNIRLEYLSQPLSLVDKHKRRRAWKDFWSNRGTSEDNRFFQAFSEQVEEILETDKPQSSSLLSFPSHLFFPDSSSYTEIPIVPNPLFFTMFDPRKLNRRSFRYYRRYFMSLPALFFGDSMNLIASEKMQRWELLPYLLQDFYDTIEKRDTLFIISSPHFFPKILEWHYLLWKKEKLHSRYSSQEVRDQLETYLFQSRQILDSMISYVVKRSLTGETRDPFSLFSFVETHVNAHQEVVDFEEYWRALPIYEACFEAIPQAVVPYSIWETLFPNSWKITIDNMRRETMAVIWWERFQDWARLHLIRQWQGTDEHMVTLNEVTRGLFPEVDLRTWARVLTFGLRPTMGTSQLRSVIETPPKFGFTSSQISKDSVKQTLELALQVFPQIFTPHSISHWQAELKTLSYPDNVQAQQEREAWQEMFAHLYELLQTSKEET